MDREKWVWLALAAGLAAGVPRASAVAEVAFDPPAGVYPEAADGFEVALSAEEGTTIWYTLDGSRPVCTNAEGELVWSATARKYDGPVAVANGRDDGPEAISRIMTGGNEQDSYDPWYPPAEPPRTIPVLRAAAVDAEERVGDVASASYLLGDMATRYGPTPVVSLCAEWADLFDNTNGPGIYRYPTAAAKKKVPNAHVEFFEGGRRQFAKWCELKLQGTTTISRPKKSLRLTGWLGYNPKKGEKEPFRRTFFADKPEVDSHACIVLRMGGNDWNRAILRDRVAQAIGAGGEVDWEAGAVCVLFLDGVYWGVHEIRERYEAGFFAQQLGIGKKNGFSLLEYADGKPFPQVNEGWGEDDEERTSDAYNDFWDILRQLEAWGDDLSDAERCAWFTNRINPDSLLQHFALELFAGNSDWPQNNQRWWRAWPDGKAGSSVDRSFPRNDGRWNWTFHDLDFAFALPFDYVPDWLDGLRAAHDPHAWIFPGAEMYVGEWVEDAARPFHAAMSNPGLRNRYLAQVYLRLATSWAAPRTLPVLERAAGELRAAGMDENGARWRQPQTAADFERQIDGIRDFLEARPEAFSWHTRRRWGLDAPRTVVVAAEGGTEPEGPAGGTVRLDGIDLADPAALPGGGLPLVAEFPRGLPLELEAVPGKGFVFDGWYATPALLPEPPPEAGAEDCAANYGTGEFPSASLGTGWGNWVAEFYGNPGEAAAFAGTSQMPIHGRSETGRSFALRASGSGYANIRRELADGAALGIGEEMSLDVGFGLSGGNGGAGVAFVTAGGEAKPVQLILADGGGEGEAYRVYIDERPYIAENFRHVPGAPLRVSLARTGADAWQLRIARGGRTWVADAELPAGTAITGVRLYKNPYGSADAKYNLWFDNLRVAPDAGSAGDAEDLAAAPQRATLFYEDGAALDGWRLSVSGKAGAWKNTEPLCNIGTPSFGLWANSGGSAILRRRFGFALTNGCDLSFAFQNNAIDDPAGCAGVTLLTDGGESCSLLALAGASNYVLRVAGSEKDIDTGVPVVMSGIGVAAAPAEDGTLSLAVAGVPFALGAPAAISGIEFFNRSAGEGTACNVFFNRVWVRADPGIGPASSNPDPDPVPENTVFHETGADIGNWIFQSWPGAGGGWAGGGSEYSAILGPESFYLYAGTMTEYDYNPESRAVRVFPDGASPCAGRTLSFRFAHGEIGTDATTGEGTVGWALLAGEHTNLFQFTASGTRDNYYCFCGTNRVPLDLAKAPGVAHSAEIRFSSDTNADFYLDGALLVADIRLGAPVGGIGFWNWVAGPGSERNLLFNDIAVTAGTEAGPATRRMAATRPRNAAGTLLSTEPAFTLVPTNDIAVTARFVRRPPSDFEIWAAERGIADPWTTNPETDRGYAEEYLLETNAVPSLQQAQPDGTYELSFESGRHGIAADILVSDSLVPAVWRTPTAEELQPADPDAPDGLRFRATPTNHPPRIFIRLSLRPAE